MNKSVDRTEVRDMVTLLALPALWRSRSPEQIAVDLVDVLASMLRLDFIHLRAGNQTHTRPALTPEIARYIERPAAPGDMRTISTQPSSLVADLSIIAGARRHEFPTPAESFLLKAALDQATVAIDQSLLLQRERDRAVELRAALNRSQRFVSLIERTTELICFAGIDRKLQFLNVAGQNLVGLSDFGSTSILDYFFAADHPVVELAVREAREYGHARRDVPFKHFGTGAAIPATWDLIAIADVDTGDLIAFGIVARDMTEQKKLDELRERLIGMMGHDLLSPLAAISIGSHVLLRRDKLAAEERSVAQRIHRSANRSAQIVRQMLDFTRTRLGGGFVLERQLVDLAELCHDVVDELQVANPTRVLIFTNTGTTHGLWDGARLSEIVSNLVSNAIKYGANEPIVIHLTGSANHVSLTVSNVGTPIAPDVLPFIFDPFRGQRQGPHAKESLGLGLYIVEQIVLAHAGTIEVRSDETGTTFTVRLPRA